MSYDDRLQRRTDRFVWACALAFGVFAIHRTHGATPPAATPSAAARVATPAATTATATPAATYRQECGDCHVAYPPQLLPATAWGQIITGLDRHFGVDASLEPATAAAISAWLARSAASGRSSRGSREDDEGGAGAAVRPGDASLRITTTPWFVREHREVPVSTWGRAAIGSASNCAACHTDANQGRFSERALRIPK